MIKLNITRMEKRMSMKPQTENDLSSILVTKNTPVRNYSLCIYLFFKHYTSHSKLESLDYEAASACFGTAIRNLDSNFLSSELIIVSGAFDREETI